jgi:uncharacterized YccA/Bax inhibitor family protein
MNSDFEPTSNPTPPGVAGVSGSGRRRRRPRQTGSWAVNNNFSRMQREFGTGAMGGAVGTALLAHPGDGARTPVSDVKPLVESDVLNKVGLLTLIALGLGGVSFLFPVSTGFAVVCIFVALGLGLWACFRPRLARVLAPIYAATEGLALGVLSRLYDSQSHGIVPLAIILTGAMFSGVLIAYRTRLVRVTNRFISMTFVATFALLAVLIASLFGLSFPGLGRSATDFIVFGVVYVIVAVLNLFTDFELVNRAARAGVPAEAEWYAAFSIFLDVVMLYLGLLRILGGRR